MTRAQLKPFFRAVNRAASAQGIFGREAVDEYRHAVMREEVGAAHTSDVDPGDGYDRVMYRLAVDGGDWSAASRFATGEERRMAALVESCARQVVELKACEESPFDKPADALAYVVGCLRQAGMLVGQGPEPSEWWMDISGSMAFSVFRMLDTHRRRLLRRLEWQGTLSFDADASWYLDGDCLAVAPVSAVASILIHVGRIPA